MSPAVIAFYIGLLAIATAVIRYTRSMLERKRRDPFALVLAGVGVLCLLAALYFSLNAPHVPAGLPRP